MRGPSNRGSGATTSSSSRSWRRSATRFEIDQYTPWNKLPAKQRKLLLDGSGTRRSSSSFEKNGRKHSFKREFEGVVANLQRRFDEYERRRREQGRTTDEDFEAIYDEFHRYMSQTVCDDCDGTRLRMEARARQGRRQEHHRDDGADHPGQRSTS